MYVFQEFPKWMYHRTEAAVIVDDPDQQEALGPDWAEHPAAFDVPVVVEDNDGDENAPAAPAADASKPKRGK